MSALAKMLPANCLAPADIETITLALEQILPGQSIVYHRGHLADDRRMRPALEKFASDVYQLALDKDREGKRRPSRLHLTQFRQARSFVYVATGKHVGFRVVR